MGYFVPDIHCSESLEGVFPPGASGGTLSRSQDPNSPYPCQLFPTQGVSETQAYRVRPRFDKIRQ